MILGCHVSMSGKDMFLGSVKEALSYNADTFMVYTGAPQNTKRKNTSELNIPAAKQLMKESGMTNFIVHAPYIINLGNAEKPATFKLAVDFLTVEIERTAAMGGKTIVLHPGSHVNMGEDVGISQIIKGLNEVLTADTPVSIALETMAGKGSEMGKSFEQLAAIFDGVTHNDKLSVCLDSCHLSDAGYDVINNFDQVIDQFDHIIGKDKVSCIHLNDSKNVAGAGKDRHENLGLGHIGFDALHYIASHPDFEHVPKILETPRIKDPRSIKDSYPPYKEEISMLRSGEFDPEFVNKIISRFEED